MDKIILQITSGRGPAECCLLVAKIYEQVLKEACKKNLTVNLLETEVGPQRGTYHSVTLELTGDHANDFAKAWLGSILWVMQSPYRKNHKRKNWYAAIHKLSVADKMLAVPDCDISYQAIRSGGPGGQHVNKVSTAIRATHKLSKLSVLASDSRSQVQNKKLAKERLIKLLQLQELQKRKAEKQEDWMNHNVLQRGNPVKVFAGSDFKIRKQN